jgi:hypothetical protein
VEASAALAVDIARAATVIRRGEAPLNECSVTKSGPDHAAIDASASSLAHRGFGGNTVISMTERQHSVRMSAWVTASTRRDERFCE